MPLSRAHLRIGEISHDVLHHALIGAGFSLCAVFEGRTAFEHWHDFGDFNHVGLGKPMPSWAMRLCNGMKKVATKAKVKRCLFCRFFHAEIYRISMNHQLPMAGA